VEEPQRRSRPAQQRAFLRGLGTPHTGQLDGQAKLLDGQVNPRLLLILAAIGLSLALAMWLKDRYDRFWGPWLKDRFGRR